MKILAVFPTYPGEPYDGSAVYERKLLEALGRRGVELRVLTTRTQRLRQVGDFEIAWPNELPRKASHDGVPIERFRALDTGVVGRRASTLIHRRWSRELVAGGEVLPGSRGYVDSLLDRARSRPAIYDRLADLGRGPIVPGLLREVARTAAGYDVVLVGYLPFSLVGQVESAARRSGTPVALLPFLHENDLYHHFQSVYRSCERADAVLTLSAHTTDFLREHLPAVRAVTIGAGVTVGEPSSSNGNLRAFRERHGLGDGNLMLYVGRKEASKRYEMAVEALRHLPGDARLVMVGKDVDRRPLESDRAVQLGVVSQEELDEAYAACDLLVLPSDQESFGMVFLDAWRHGKPVIGNSLCGSAAALIEDGRDGFLCADAEQLGAAASRLFGDRDLARRMGESGREKVVAEFTWDRVADRALDCFADLAGAGAGGR